MRTRSSDYRPGTKVTVARVAKKAKPGRSKSALQVFRIPELFAIISQFMPTRDLMHSAASCREMRLNAYGSARWAKLVGTAKELTQLKLYSVITEKKHPLHGELRMPACLAQCGREKACKNISPLLYPATDGTLFPHNVAYRLEVLQKLVNIFDGITFVDYEKNLAFFKCLSGAFKVAKQIDVLNKSVFYTEAQANLLLRIPAVDGMHAAAIAKLCNLFKGKNVRFNAMQINNFLDMQDEEAFDKLICSPCGRQAVSLFPSGIILNWLKFINDMESAADCLSIVRAHDNTTVACLLAAAGEKRTRFIDETDEEGQTALHYAAFHGVQSAFTALLQNGADLDCQDTKGMTPRQLASEHTELRPFLVG